MGDSADAVNKNANWMQKITKV